MIVVDTNVIAWLFLSSPYSKAAEELYCNDSDRAAPRLRRSELQIVLTHYVHKQLLSTDDTVGIFTAASDVTKGRGFGLCLRICGYSPFPGGTALHRPPKSGKGFSGDSNKNRNSGLTSPPSRSTVMQR